MIQPSNKQVNSKTITLVANGVSEIVRAPAGEYGFSVRSLSGGTLTLEHTDGYVVRTLNAGDNFAIALLSPNFLLRLDNAAEPANVKVVAHGL